ncbi:MAG: DUF4867 family protein [Eubacteriales bacterium]|nr:DUF4867 family protein [Lachnospiraceae bacterium]MDO5127681.1 DUF4867 family protein [Eubacteriales bacterium]
MEIKKVTDPAFRKYGRVLENYDFSQLIEAMEKSPLPEDVIYEPSIDYLESLPIAQEFKVRAYGELDVQVGFCNGHNKKLNAAEYHRSSELNIACKDAVLILGKQEDVEEDNTYDTSKMEAFFLPAGVGVEVFATTLHYAPCNPGDDGFKVVIVLPKGTNYPLAEKHAGGEDALLAATNKWLIGHAEGGLPEGSFIGLKGENLSI